MNATGGWTAIDEELDATSTNPVQNKTLYNLETYHTLNYYSGNYSSSFMIDNGLDVKTGTSVKLFFEKDLKSTAGRAALRIKPGLYGSEKNVRVTSKKILRKTVGGPYGSTGQIETPQNNKSLYPHDVLEGFDDKGEAKYTSIYFIKNTAIELIYTNHNDVIWAIIGDPIVGMYQFDYKYFTAPVWDVSANAVVYASGLKIQWGSFTYHSASNDEYATQETYFPVKFEETPSMSFTFDTNIGSGALDADVVHRDTPYAVNNEKWKLHAAADGTYGTWQAIGY